MRILWVKVGGLWPCNTGGRLRSFHMLKQLSKRHSITVLTSADDAGQQQSLRRELPACAHVMSVSHRIPKWRSGRFAVALARSWLSSLPVEIRRCSVPALRAEAGRRLLAGDVDLCIADFLAASINVPACSRVPLLLFSHNVEHMIWKRLAAVERRPLQRAALELEWRKLRQFEASASVRATLTVAVSQQDAAQIAGLAPGAEIRAIPTGVDTDYFTPGDTEPLAEEIVYVGSMDWRPNEDAVRHFLRDILPAVRLRIPAARFTVVGRDPSPALRAEAQRHGATMTGTVADVRPFVRKASVFVVPLRVGGGTRLKIFEALAMAKAVVATPVGAEGLPLVANRHFVCADGPGAFSEAVISLMRDPARRTELGCNGCDLVKAQYSWSQVTKTFDALCMEACELHRDAGLRQRAA